MIEDNTEVGKLSINFSVNSNYSEHATEIRKYSMDFEKWLLTMLVFAAGSALSFVILQVIKIPTSDSNFLLLIVCAWLFAFSLFFSFYGIAHFSSGLNLRNEELIARHNKQDGEQNIKSALQKTTDAVYASKQFKMLPLNKQHEKIYDENFLLSQLSSGTKKSYFDQLDRIKKFEQETERYNLLANKRYKIFRIYISISFLALMAGISIPLLFLTYKAVFNG